MTTSFKLFLMLFLLIFTGVFTETQIDLDKYRLYVTEVDPEFHCFTLSNQMVCYVAQNNWETDLLPEVGAEIRLAPKKRNPAMTLIEEGEFLAFLSKGLLKKLIPVG